MCNPISPFKSPCSSNKPERIKERWHRKSKKRRKAHTARAPSSSMNHHKPVPITIPSPRAHHPSSSPWLHHNRTIISPSNGQNKNEREKKPAHCRALHPNSLHLPMVAPPLITCKKEEEPAWKKRRFCIEISKQIGENQKAVHFQSKQQLNEPVLNHFVPKAASIKASNSAAINPN
ncbi:hypothetical protein M0R45_019547 [Rubus argutus]|uniref:Uncharacterized protein n=1 Tax=Rubus argutus TaxID=59490 RepID=A0AAW1X7N0_RUBAR